MKQYKLLNNVMGWLSFAIAATVYLMTLEPTASFWDCPEFITSAFKLEVGHPPGNSFFNLTGRFFANFAGGDVTKVAYMINAMSALCSAATILFLYWTTTHLLRKLVTRNNSKEEMSLSQMITILGGGMVAALAYTFSDTFWYSAVEGEVYAFSSLMTAVVFWLILKWEANADDVHAERYIILIAYVMGLSVGVHLLNLLCIPAIVLVYYFKKVPEADLKGTFIALVGSGALILAVLYGLIPGYIKLSGYVELFFVNTLGFDYNTGTIFYFFFVLTTLIWGIYETLKAQSKMRAKIALIASIILLGIPFLGDGFWIGLILSAAIGAYLYFKNNLPYKMTNTLLLSMLVFFAGYSSFAQIIVRSVANPPMNQNNPDEIFSYQKYANREQYGDRPLFFGNTFVSDYERNADGSVVMEEGAKVWSKVVKTNADQADQYVSLERKEKVQFQKELNMLFPRMYSRDANHIEAYKQWSNFKGTPKVVMSGGEKKTVMKPTFSDNLSFFFKYQLNYMYWRYFMWNFSGRQNDLQGYGEITKGNWITGINFIDQLFVGDQSDLPADMKDNQGRNVYYMLPLILGILGLIYQLQDKRAGTQQFIVVFLLFFMTGIAIVVYLNQTPYQPRERDYAYAGSFYAFSIWIGLGVAYLKESLEKLLKNQTLSAAIVTVLALCVPIQMAAQNWDDHDRSGRYAARDFAKNYLVALEEDAIIFTNGDNDTFPLWYIQEVEGFRRDVRVCNLSYLNTDWYINQMKSPAYNSPALPIGFDQTQYAGNKLNVAYLMEMTKQPIALDIALNFLASDEQRTKTVPGYPGRIDFLPSKQLLIPVDSSKVIANPLFDHMRTKELPKEIKIDLSKKNIVTKNEIMALSMLNSIAREGWNRPIYYALTTPSSLHMNLQPYFSLVGLAYQVTPYRTGSNGEVNVDLMYDNMMNKYVWGGVDQPGVYLDETVRRLCQSQRGSFSALSDALIRRGDKARARKVLDYSLKVLPVENIPLAPHSLVMARDYFLVDAPEEGLKVASHILDNAVDNLEWYFQLKPHQLASVVNEVNNELAALYQGIDILEKANQKEKASAYTKSFEMYYTAFQQLQ